MPMLDDLVHSMLFVRRCHILHSIANGIIIRVAGYTQMATFLVGTISDGDL